MEQWVKHFHEWWPLLRIVVLHQSGTYNGKNIIYIKYNIIYYFYNINKHF